MRNFIQSGESITMPAPYDRLGGEGALVGAQFGVAKSTVLNGVAGEFATEGVFELAKTSAQTWAFGDKIYWDNINKRCDNVGTVGMLIGCATAAAANPSSVGDVLLGDAPGLLTGPQAAQATIATADGSDPASTQALANALKVTVNALLVKLRTAGIILP